MLWPALIALATAAAPASLDGARTADLVGAEGTHRIAPLAWPQGASVVWTDPGQGADVVALTTARGLPARAELPVGRVFATADLAWTTLGDASPGALVGTLEVVYADGQALVEKVRLDHAVSRLASPSSGPRTEVLPVGGGRGVSLHHWSNPRPAVPVDTLVLRSRSSTLTWVLFGLTVDPAPSATPGVSRPVDGFPFALRPDSPPPPQPAASTIAGPAGRHGFVQVRDGRFAFEDGTPARFWGVNLTSGACVPPVDQAAELAAHLADMGFNMVRLHHCDSRFAGLVRPGGDPEAPLFEPEVLTRYDTFVAALKAEGIYVFLELATLREFGPADGVHGSGPGIPSGHKLVPMFDPDWRRAYLDWGRAWLGRTNQVTGVPLAQDPAIAVVELSNEHSLSVSWGNGGLEQLPAVHRVTLDRLWNTFLQERYPDAGALEAAWTGSVHPGVQSDEAWGTLRREPATRAVVSAWPAQRQRDLLAFYRDLERAFYDDVEALVRDELGFRVPLTPTISFGRPELAELVDTFDFTDTHFSFDNPGSARVIENRSLIAHPRTQRGLERMAFAHHERPACISEVNHTWPNEQMAEGPLLWASVASLQAWDCVIWFDYRNGPYSPEFSGVGGQHELQDAQVKWAQMPAASALFRGGEVAPAEGLWVRHLSPEAVAETGAPQVWPELKDVGFLLGHRLRRSFGREPPRSVPGEPGEQVGWWVQAGRLVLDTATLQAVVGDHGLAAAPGVGEGGGPTAAPGLAADLDGFAAVSLWSLDGQPLAVSRQALLTVAGSQHNDGQLWDASRRTLLHDGDGPVHLTRPSGQVRFAWRGKPQVRPVFADGTRGPAVPVERLGQGWWSLELDTAGPTLWWEVTSG